MRFANQRKRDVITILMLMVLTITLSSCFSLPRSRSKIDTNGGITITFAPEGLDRKPTEQEWEIVRGVFEARLDQRNILDREIVIAPVDGYVNVTIPWEDDGTEFEPQNILPGFGERALLTFNDPEGNIILDGKHIAGASPEKDEYGGYVVNLTLKEEGRKIFAKETERLTGQNISIYLDEQIIASPKIMVKIDSDQCGINGLATKEAARDFANKINAGNLPFALVVKSCSYVSPIK